VTPSIVAYLQGAAGLADGVLVPVEHLVNGVSIEQCEAVEGVGYFHVELDSHDVIVVDGRDLCRGDEFCPAGKN
jgi:Hint domain